MAESSSHFKYKNYMDKYTCFFDYINKIKLFLI